MSDRIIYLARIFAVPARPPLRGRLMEKKRNVFKPVATQRPLPLARGAFFEDLAKDLGKRLGTEVTGGQSGVKRLRIGKGRAGVSLSIQENAIHPLGQVPRWGALPHRKRRYWDV